jgi:hypothetical protein
MMYCDYLVLKFDDSLVLESRLAKYDPLIFEPQTAHCASQASSSSRQKIAGIEFLSADTAPAGHREDIPGGVDDFRTGRIYLSYLTIGLDIEEATIRGQVITQASTLHFCRRIHDHSIMLTLTDFFEICRELAEGHHLDKGICLHIQLSNMHGRFGLLEKHEILNTS